MSGLQAAAAVAEAPNRAWFRLVRAAGVTGAASLAGAALSVASGKIFAAVLGPSGIAVLGTLQQIRQTSVIGATLNGQAALVQGLSASGGKQPAGSRNPAAGREFLRTSILLIGAATLSVSSGLLLAPGWVARFAGISSARRGLIPWLTFPVVLSCALVVLSALLNASRKIGRLALVQTAAPAAMALLAYPAARATMRGNETALVWWIAAVPACAASLALVLAGRRQLETWCSGPGRWWNPRDARRFLTISGSLLAGGAAGAVALLATRARILQHQGLEAAGEFDAAWAISMNHVSLLLGSLQTYCLPELASDPNERAAHLRRMLAAAALCGATAVCALAAFKPAVIALLYSEAFHGAARFLRWTLLGDYLKVSSWVLSISMLAAADMRAFLGADLIACTVFAAGAAVAGRFRGAAEGAAIGFALMYAAHLLVCGWIVMRRYGFRPDGRLVTLWIAGLAVVAAVSAWSWEQA